MKKFISDLELFSKDVSPDYVWQVLKREGFSVKRDSNGFYQSERPISVMYDIDRGGYIYTQEDDND